jgi:hypothetical protein
VIFKFKLIVFQKIKKYQKISISKMKLQNQLLSNKNIWNPTHVFTPNMKREKGKHGYKCRSSKSHKTCEGCRLSFKYETTEGIIITKHENSPHSVPISLNIKKNWEILNNLQKGEKPTSRKAIEVEKEDKKFAFLPVYSNFKKLNLQEEVDSYILVPQDMNSMIKQRCFRQCHDARYQYPSDYGSKKKQSPSSKFAVDFELKK